MGLCTGRDSRQKVAEGLREGVMLDLGPERGVRGAQGRGCAHQRAHAIYVNVNSDQDTLEQEVVTFGCTQAVLAHVQGRRCVRNQA